MEQMFADWLHVICVNLRHLRFTQEPDKQLGKTQPSSEQPACHARC